MHDNFCDSASEKNGQSVDFTLHKVYSGIDLCMKLSAISPGVSASFLMQIHYLPALTRLTSISMFVVVVSNYFMFLMW